MTSPAVKSQLNTEPIFQKMTNRMKITQSRFNILCYFVFFLNFVITLLGIAITVIAILLKLDPSFFKMNTSFNIPVLNPVVYVALIVGLITLVVGFLGCWGAFHRNKWMLLSYVIAVAILVIIQVVIAASALKAINDPEVQRKVNDFLKNRLIDREMRKGNSEFMDFVQTKLKCCGIDGPDDYHSLEIPPSCFDENYYYHKEGCSREAIDYIKKYATEIGAVILGAFFVQLIVGNIVVCLYCSIIHSSSTKNSSSSITKDSTDDKQSHTEA